MAAPRAAPVAASGDAEDALALADQALQMVRANRFAIALGLLDEARRQARKPIVSATLREKEATVRLEIARRMMQIGNDVAARAELVKVLALSPGDLEAASALALVKRKETTTGLKGTAIVAATPSPRPAVRSKRSRAKGRARPDPPDRSAGARLSSRAPDGSPPPPHTAKPKLVVLASPTAAVRVDGKYLGVTPIRGEAIEPGPHELVIEAPGHLPQRRAVQAEPGKQVYVSVTLVPKPAPARNVANSKILQVPALRLPHRLTVPTRRADGQRSPEIRAICDAVERTVTKSIDRSATGVTALLQDHLYGSSDARVHLYPRTMGYVIARALLQNRRDPGPQLVELHRSGRLASLARANWRP